MIYIAWMKVLLTLLIAFFTSISFGQVVNDVALDSTWFVGQNCAGKTYAQIPQYALNEDYLIGALVKNVGLDTQTNVILDINFLLLDTTVVVPSLPPDSSFFLEIAYPGIFNPSSYICAYSVNSDQDTVNGVNSGNNLHSFKFLVNNGDQNNECYALDGIGTYDSVSTIGFGTHLFPNLADGLMVANLYHNLSFNGAPALELVLGPETIPYGEYYCYFIDSVDFWNGTPWESLTWIGYAQITQADVNNGYSRCYSSNYINITGTKYLVAELYSNAHENEISILDDLTVTEPAEASVYYSYLDSSVHTSPNALGIRLKVFYGGLDEYTLSGISIYPNPTDGVVHVSNDEFRMNHIEVYNVLGQMLFSDDKQIEAVYDLSVYGAGIYLVNVTNETGKMSRRIVVH